MNPAADAALRFEDVHVSRGGVAVLRGLDWEVSASEKWAVLGPNGSGKTTTFELASGYLHPTAGAVEVLGRRLGRVDVRRLRERIGLVSPAVAKKLVPSVTAVGVVLAGLRGELDPWWHEHSAAERDRAEELLARVGFREIADRPFGSLSEGERQQVLIARCLVADPALVLLDEPAAGLDLGARESLLSTLARVAHQAGGPPLVIITHHVEEIPAGFTHALLLRRGRAVAAGPMADALTSASLSETFGVTLELSASGGRWSCRAA